MNKKTRNDIWEMMIFFVGLIMGIFISLMSINCVSQGHPGDTSTYLNESTENFELAYSYAHHICPELGFDAGYYKNTIFDVSRGKFLVTIVCHNETADQYHQKEDPHWQRIGVGDIWPEVKVDNEGQIIEINKLYW